MAHVVWTDRALNNLEDIALHIADDSPLYARAFVVRIVGAVERLSRLPRQGRTVPEFGDETLRELIFQNYRVVYRIDGDRVGIVAVRHGAMRLPPDLQRQSWDLP